MERDRRIKKTGYRNEVNPKLNELDELTQRSRKALEKKGLTIIEVEKESLYSLRNKGVIFASEWHKGWEFEKEYTRPAEVAIDLRRPVLPNSNYLSIIKQKDLIKNYNSSISKKIPDVEAVIDQVSVYAQVIPYYIEATGGDEFYGKYVVTNTKTERNEVASIGSKYEEGLEIISSNPKRRNPIIYASPVLRRKVA